MSDINWEEVSKAVTTTVMEGLGELDLSDSEAEMYKPYVEAIAADIQIAVEDRDIDLMRELILQSSLVDELVRVHGQNELYDQILGIVKQSALTAVRLIVIGALA